MRLLTAADLHGSGHIQARQRLAEMSGTTVACVKEESVLDANMQIPCPQRYLFWLAERFCSTFLGSDTLQPQASGPCIPLYLPLTAQWHCLCQEHGTFLVDAVVLMISYSHVSVTQ